MQKGLIAILFMAIVLCANISPVLADCRTENVACVKGASSPFDSMACGSLYRSCAANHARAAQQQAKQPQSANRPAIQNTSPSSGGHHSGRR
jgi:hypothetical protein